jgi:hypothetical protein
MEGRNAGDMAWLWGRGSVAAMFVTTLEGTPMGEIDPNDVGGQAGAKSVDLSRLSTLTRNDWLSAGAGVVAFVASFLPWYTVELDGGGSGRRASYSASGWDVGIGGWLPVLLLMTVAGVIVARALGVTVPAQVRPHLGLGLVAVPAAATAVILLRWLTFPGGEDALGSAGAGFGLYVGLLTAVVSGVGAARAFNAGPR